MMVMGEAQVKLKDEEQKGKRSRQAVPGCRCARADKEGKKEHSHLERERAAQCVCIYDASTLPHRLGPRY